MRYIGGLLSMLLFLAGPFARGESEGSTVFELKDFVVRSWHIEESTLRVPADVTVIDRTILDQSLALNLPDLLEAEANLFFSTVSGFTSVDMRGFGEGSGLRSLLLVDGQVLNPSDMGRIVWEQIPPDSIESVEVLRGGHNVLYGDKALAGVIKVETRKSNETRLGVSGRVLSFDGRQGSIDGGFGTHVMNVSFGVSDFHTEGYRENSAEESTNAYLSLSYDLTEEITLEGRVTAVRSELLYPGPLNASEYREDPRQAGTLFDDGSESRSSKAGVRVKGSNQGVDWELTTGYDQNLVDYRFGGSNRFGENDERGFLLKPSFTRRWEFLTAILGVDYTMDRLESIQYSNLERSITTGRAQIEEDRLGGYLFFEQDFADSGVSLSAGYRQEWNSYAVDYIALNTDQQVPYIIRRGGAIMEPNPDYKNPPDIVPEDSFDGSLDEIGRAVEVSVNWQYADRSSLWMGYDRVYRYPVFDERSYYQGFGQPYFDLNLEAERGDNFEFGGKFLGDHHQLFVTGYFLRMENEIGFDPAVVSGTGAGLNVNLGAVDRYGLDVTWKYRRDTWGVDIALNYINTEIKDGSSAGNEVPEVPNFRATSSLWWEPLDFIRVRLLHRYVGGRYPGGDSENSLQRLDSYELVDLALHIDTSENSKIFAKVTNLFDELYPEATTGDDFYPGSGRQLSVGARLNF